MVKGPPGPIVALSLVTSGLAVPEKVTGVFTEKRCPDLGCSNFNTDSLFVFNFANRLGASDWILAKAWVGVSPAISVREPGKTNDKILPEVLTSSAIPNSNSINRDRKIFPDREL